MLNLQRHRSRGFTLVELVTVVSIIALLTLAAIPTFSTWIGNARVRTVAESLQNDLRLAQAEAMRRNRQTVFALTTSTPAWNATPAANGTNWYLRVQPSASAGETATSDADTLLSVNTTAKRAGATITGPALLCFNSMGQTISVAAANTGLATKCDAASPTTYAVTKTGADKKLNVLVYLGGRVFMCDPDKTQSDTNPDGCPPA